MQTSVRGNAGKFRFYRNYTSHMVLQRDRPVVLAGLAEPGKTLAVTFDEETVLAQADGQGEWKAVFPPRPAGGPWVVALAGAPDVPPVRLDDVMTGEVWFCSGQSNMEMPLYSNDPFWRAANAQKEMAEADYPGIRLFNATAAKEISPDARRMDDMNRTGWERCTPESVRNFSACAYFFARQLHRDLGVTVGVVSAAWGGSRIQAWISRETMAEHHWIPECSTQEHMSGLWQKLYRTPEYQTVVRWAERFDAVLGNPPEEELLPGFDDSGWDSLTEFPAQLPHLGRYLVRVEADVPPELAGKPMVLHGMIMDDADQSFFNGRFIGKCGTETCSYWSKVRHYEIPGEWVRQGRNLLAVIADVQFNHGVFTLPEYPFRDRDGNVLNLRRGAVRVRLVSELDKAFPLRPAMPRFSYAAPAQDNHNYPATLFQGMIAPWLRFAFRGILWYQGCNDSGRADYYPLHQMLIKCFREEWHAPEMPFILVQLAAYHQSTPQAKISDDAVEALPLPENVPYGVTREIQYFISKHVPHTGMITAFDCGEACDIHPRNKQVPGYRLAKKAESMVYGSGELSDGPEFAGMKFEGDQIRIFWRNTGSGLVTRDGEPPKGFFLSDGIGIWHRAEAQIDGDTVLVRAGEVPSPQFVRYAYCGFCRVNLFNREGWPALPFRSDAPDYRALFGENLSF